MAEKIMRYKCFTEEQQRAFETLPPRQRKYVEFRGQGYAKTEAYIMSGYKKSKTCGQAAWLLEKDVPIIKELIQVRLDYKKAREVFEPDSRISQQIDALADQSVTNEVLNSIESVDKETAAQIKFYRDVAAGKIKTKKKTEYVDKTGMKTYKNEEIDDVDVRMRARRELDRILGITKVLEIGKVEMGDITINIVDASKKEEITDSRNKVDVFKKEKNEDVIVVESASEEFETEEKVIVEDKPVEKFFKRVVVE